MIKKLFPILLLGLLATTAQGQSFYLPEPANWRPEKILFPIDFAPHIPYSGEEHLRFAPGWGATNSEELWSYCFVWWIQADAKVSKESLEKDLQEYYGGLVARNIISRKIDSKLVVPTLTSFKEVEMKEAKSFEGTVSMLDYMSLKPLILHVVVTLNPCTKDNKLAVFIAVSPQPRTHAIWQQFKSIWDGFRCVK